jgi:hypothetical protein
MTFPRFARDDNDKPVLPGCQSPFFQTECKGKGLFIPTQILLIYFSEKNKSFGVKINFFCEELSLLFKAGRQR